MHAELQAVLPWGYSILGCTLAGAAVQLIASTGLREGFVLTWLVVMLYCGRGGSVYRAWGWLLAGGAVAAVAVLQQGVAWPPRDGVV